MQELFVTLITFFLVDPLQREIASVLAASQAPQDIVAALVTCASEHGRLVVDRALEDPWWAVSSAASVWVGLAEPAALLVEAAPACATAVEAAEPFLAGSEEEAAGG